MSNMITEWTCKEFNVWCEAPKVENTSAASAPAAPVAPAPAEAAPVEPAPTSGVTTTPTPAQGLGAVVAGQGASAKQ